MKVRVIAMIVLLLGFTGHTSAQDSVNLTLSDIPPGQQVTITYETRVNENLPQGLQFISNQGMVSGRNFLPVLSNDPDTAVSGDPTRTQVGFTLQVQELPRTGEAPWWRALVISAVLAGLVAAGVYSLLRRQFRV